MSASILLLQKPRTIEVVREAFKVPEIEKSVEKIVIEVKKEDLLLPDLVLEAPKELHITGAGTKRKLRFNTTFTNLGDGPFEVIGHTDTQKEITFASQYIKRKDGTGLYREIGNFIFHSAHKHWHVANHVVYEIWGMEPSDGQGRLLSTSGKMSICLFDDRPADLSLPEAPKTRTYFPVCSSRIQGVSVGWSDVYLSRIEGQEIDIGNVSDGIYIFKFKINPDNKILEKNYDNNSGMIKIEIKGNRVKVI